MSIMDTADLADFVGECQVNFHSFADDSQTYMHCSLGDVCSVFCQLEGCITEVSHWMYANRLLKMQIRQSLSALVSGIT